MSFTFLFNSLLLLAELGDFVPDVHTPYFISEFRFIPDQTESFELAALDAFKKCK